MVSPPRMDGKMLFCSQMRQIILQNVMQPACTQQPQLRCAAQVFSKDYTGFFRGIVFCSCTVAPLGFECQLSRGGAKSPAPLHAWAPCASPVAVSGLTDASYLFEVRGKGEKQLLLAVSCQPKETGSSASARMDLYQSRIIQNRFAPANVSLQHQD